MKPANGTSYEAAVKELEGIVKKMENNEIAIDEIADQLKKAQQLIKLCRDKLTKAEAEIKKLTE